MAENVITYLLPCAISCESRTSKENSPPNDPTIVNVKKDDLLAQAVAHETFRKEPQTKLLKLTPFTHLKSFSKKTSVSSTYPYSLFGNELPQGYEFETSSAPVFAV